MSKTDRLNNPLLVDTEANNSPTIVGAGQSTPTVYVVVSEEKRKRNGIIGISGFLFCLTLFLLLFFLIPRKPKVTYQVIFNFKINTSNK
jgi:hypothetical protein